MYFSPDQAGPELQTGGKGGNEKLKFTEAHASHPQIVFNSERASN